MAMLAIQDLLEDLEVGEYGSEITDYSNDSSYICDVITEIADSNTSIYYSDIIKFIADNVEAVNNAIIEFGWEGCGSDLYKAGQMGEFLSIENDLYSNLDDIILYYALDYFSDTYGKEISEDDLEALKDNISDIDNSSRIWDIKEVVDDIFNNVEDD